MSEYIPRRSWFDITVDRQGVYLAILLVIVQIGAVTVALAMQSGAAGTAPERVTATGDAGGGAAVGAGWAVAEVALAVGILAAIAIAARLSPFAKSVAKGNLKLLAVYFGSLILATNVGIWAGVLPILGLYTLKRFAEIGGLWWVANNALVLVIAIYGGAVMGQVLNAWAILVFLVGMTLYDRYFADKKTYMQKMVAGIIGWRLPVIFVKPGRWRFEWSELLEEDSGVLDTDGGRAWGIGTADLLLPAGFTAAVATGAGVVTPRVAVAAVLVGVIAAAFRIRRKMLTQGSGAGLPPLTAGVAIAYAAVALPVVIGL